MGLPNANVNSRDLMWYSAEVGGRILGVATMPSLLADGERRAALEASGNAVLTNVRALAQAYTVRLVFEYVENRITVGKGRGIDRGWDGTMMEIADRARLSTPDRKTSAPEYRAIYTDGTTTEFTQPTIKQDPELAVELRRRLTNSGLSIRGELLEMLSGIETRVAPAATAMKDGESQVNDLFKVEVAARLNLVNTLWEERKTVEKLLGRGGRSTARFIFFDFRPSTSAAATEPDSPPTVESNPTLTNETPPV